MITIVLVLALIQSFDLNGDGRVTRQEYLDATWTAHVRNWGLDPSGRLTTGAMVNSLCRTARADQIENCRHGTRGLAIIIDRNRDGYIGRAESDADASNMFAKADDAHRGFLTVKPSPVP